MSQKIKRIIAVIAITFGVLFTLGMLLNIWGVIEFGPDGSMINRLVPTLGVLTAAFITLLGIIRMIEEKKK